MLHQKDPVSIFFESLKLGLKIEWLILVQIWKVILQLEAIRPGISIALFIALLGISGVLSSIVAIIVFCKFGQGNIWAAMIMLPNFLLVVFSVGCWIFRQENPFFRDIRNLLAYVQKVLCPLDTLPARIYTLLQTVGKAILPKVQQAMVKVKKFLSHYYLNSLPARIHVFLQMVGKTVLQKVQQLIAKLKKFFS